MISLAKSCHNCATTRRKWSFVDWSMVTEAPLCSSICFNTSSICHITCVALTETQNYSKLFIVTDNHLELRTFFFQNVLTRHSEPDQTSTLRTRSSICDAFIWHRVLAESTRKGTDKYKFAQHGFISNKYLLYDIWKLVNLCVCIQRGSKREHAPGDKCMSAFTTWDHMQNFILGNAGNTSKNHVVINDHNLVQQVDHFGNAKVAHLAETSAMNIVHMVWSKKSSSCIL